jgi:O-antigen biosynthesis protein
MTSPTRVAPLDEEPDAPPDAPTTWLRYQKWILRHTPCGDDLYRQQCAVSRLSYRPLISIVVPVFDTPPEMLRRLLSSVTRQTYSHWQLCLVDDGSAESWISRMLSRLAATDSRVRFCRRATNGGISAATNDAVAMSTGEFVLFVDHDDEIDPRMLHAAVRHLNLQSETDIIHFDLDLLMPTGARARPVFLPQWSPELLVAAPYIVHPLVRRSCLDTVGTLRSELDGAQDYDLALRLAEVTNRIAHVPGIFYHWRVWERSASSGADAKPYAVDARKRAASDAIRRRGIAAESVGHSRSGLHRVRFNVIGAPLVSLIVTLAHAAGVDGSTSQARAARLRRVIEHTAYRQFEIVLVGPRPLAWDVATALDGHGGVTVRGVATDATDPGVMVNLGASDARGAHLLVLAATVEPGNDEWLSALIEYSQQPAIGAVGAQIFRADHTVWHAGVIIPHGSPVAVRQDLLLNPGQCSEALHGANFSAVSGDCLMTRRQVFNDVDGFRPATAVGFSDVDYCLRVRQRGHRIVFTPFSRLRHAMLPPSMFPRHGVDAFRTRWADYSDQYHNPNLSPDGSFLAIDE